MLSKVDAVRFDLIDVSTTMKIIAPTDGIAAIR
jgi:hypothetical protein